LQAADASQELGEEEEEDLAAGSEEVGSLALMPADAGCAAAREQAALLQPPAPALELGGSWRADVCPDPPL
jgi:hypothetical protein